MMVAKISGINRWVSKLKWTSEGVMDDAAAADDDELARVK